MVIFQNENFYYFANLRIQRILQFVQLPSSLNFTFNHPVLPQITPFSFGDDQDVNFDEAVAATCIITKGDLPIHIWWTIVDSFNGVEKNLTTNDGVVITRTSQKLSLLNIDSVKARHRGNYTCYAKNNAGISQHSAFLSVHGDCDFLKLDINFPTQALPALQNFAIYDPIRFSFANYCSV